MSPIVAVVRANLDRATGWGFVAAGGVAVTVGWVGASGGAGAVAQVSYLISGGLIGLLLLAAGVFVLLSADLADRERLLHGQASRTSSRRPPRRAVISATGFGAVLVGLGWAQASTASDGSSALPWALLGTAGVVLAAAVAAATLAGWSRRLQNEQVTDLGDPATDLVGFDDDRVVVATGLTRFHHRGCFAVAGGNDGREVPRDSVPSELRPCGICHAVVAGPREARR